MSALLAVVQTVASTPLPSLSPSPSPEVVTVVKEVIPAWVGQLQTVLKQAAELGLLVVPGVAASIAHNFVNQKLTTWGNALVLFGYSIVLGVLGLIASDQLNLLTVNWKNPEVVGTAILTVLGAASAKYAAYKATHSSKGEVSASTTSQTAAEF